MNQVTLQNGNPWRPHNGGPCPVDRGTLVDVRYRDGMKRHGLPARESCQGAYEASEPFWVDEESCMDITAWRYHAPAQEEQEPMSQDSPLKRLRTALQRRREAEADYQQALADVREELGEGFSIVERDQPSEDMDDPKNWRVGDVVECVKDEWFSVEAFSIGGKYTIMGFDEDFKKKDKYIRADDEEGDCMTVPADHFRFVRRP